MVKADAYGHGMWQCGAALVEAGVDRLCVATAEEAVGVREISREVPVVILGALTDSELEVALGAGAEIPAWEEGFIDRIEQLNARGVTFVVIEHDMDLVMRHCDPVIALAEGKVLFQGTAAEAQANPQLLDAYLGAPA